MSYKVQNLITKTLPLQNMNQAFYSQWYQFHEYLIQFYQQDLSNYFPNSLKGLNRGITPADLTFLMAILNEVVLGNLYHTDSA